MVNLAAQRMDLRECMHVNMNNIIWNMSLKMHMDENQTEILKWILYMPVVVVKLTSLLVKKQSIFTSQEQSHEPLDQY